MKIIAVRFPMGTYTFMLDDAGKLLEVSTSENTGSAIGDIYVGRVEQVKKNINSAFIRISESEKVFLSLQEQVPYFYTKKLSEKQAIVQGDEMLVQIEKEAYKSKLAKVTGSFVLTGRYIILTTDKKKIFVSSKINQQTLRKSLKARLKKYVTEDYGFIVRTNAELVPIEVLIDEIKAFSSLFEEIVSGLQYKKLYSKVYQPEEAYLQQLKNLSLEQSITIEVCQEDLRREISNFCDAHEMDVAIDYVSGYDVNELINQYALKDQLKKALNRKVWLKSGASIVIDPTEAMTVIDVNTEKTLSRKKRQETILNTNLEAAKAIMKEIRKRNIGGIVIVDFIDMDDAEDNKKLMTYLETLAFAMSVKTTLHGMTTLGLVEMTRKKLSKPIAEDDLIQHLLEI